MAPPHTCKRSKAKSAARRPGVTTPTYAAGPPPIAPDFLDETIAVWQPHTERALTREDAREIIENMVGFFSVLQEWDESERRAASKQAADSLSRNRDT